MKLKSIFKKTPVIKPEVKETASQIKPEVPEGLLKRCNKCGKGIFTEDYKKNLYICPKCGGYLRMPAQKRIEFLTEADSFEEWDTGLSTENPLHMIGYPDKIKALQDKTKLDEAVVTGKARIGENEVALMVMDGRFLMASMGEVVGEKIARGVERATKEKLPVIIFTCSGGARMQEGMTSLMQMAKTSAALKRHSDAGLLYITVLTDPTTGGVTASFAMLGDIILAEPKALIGFAGPRVIEQTIHKKLPKGFQRSEFLLKHGFIDKIVERKDMKTVLEQILTMHRLTTKHSGIVKNTGVVSEIKTDLNTVNPSSKREDVQAVSNKNAGKSRKQKLSLAQKKRAGEKTAWERVLTSREKDRPVGEDYIYGLFEEFIEFHGDRNFGDDAAICGGIAYFQGKPVTVIAQMKGKSTAENIERNFGMPEPEGYRKALRLMKQAEKFHRPIICFVDTPGAFCGMEAEERGQGEAIARNLYEMSALKTPILSVLIGEGGSGGALAMAVADEVWILENAVYSILSPEGYAAILWKDGSQAARAAKAMKLTSYDLYKAGFVEKIIPEPEGYTLDSIINVFDNLEENISIFLKNSKSMTEEERVEQRYQRFRSM
ncbi:acetyl-CoA carboxylase carboxyltransferase subunit beta [Anaerobutyricum soehngenii]|uniref:Multifunctional fusion protein n=1 Tax=Anaerobutyricum soehngenii TaxID=105843 RepID=A0ABS3ZI58_9FIRM|nr:acetyl-CoA carboxylase carboxyltransferase subunit alpha [Anaerobutyricum soehngenii]MBP0057003.1 acetyl-CoA carboxylase carboxyltransferase subunit beta [Anaerobutyricum soehngenii]